MKSNIFESDRSQPKRIPRVVKAIIELDANDRLQIKPVVDVDADVDRLMAALRREFAGEL